MGVTVEAGGSKQHKIIEAGRDCGRGKDPASRGMLLGWDSDTCEETDVEEEVEEMEGEGVAASCSDITSNQELSNADHSNEDHSVEVTSIDSIDRGLETEAVNHIETEVSGGAPAPGLSLVLLILSFSYSL